MRTACAALVASLVVNGCGSCRSPFTKAGPPAVRFSDGQPAFIAALDGDSWGDGPVTVHVLELADGGVRERGGWMVPRRDGMLPAVAVHADTLYVAERDTVQRRKPLRDDGVHGSMPVKEPPSSLLGARDGCFAGLQGRVDWLDFTSPRGLPVVVHEDPQVIKPVDFIVRTDDVGLVAVDDEAFPRYAFVLEMTPDAPAVHRFTSSLPSGPNESYRDVVHVDRTLIVAATFGVMDGSGNTLYRWPITRKEHAGDPIGEFQSDVRPGIPPRLLAGTSLTLWNGLGAVGDHLFIGAGERGVLHMPVQGQPAALHDAEGWVLDLVVVGNEVLALMAVPGSDGRAPEYRDRSVTGDRALVVLAWDASAGTLTQTARHALDANVDWLVI